MQLSLVPKLNFMFHIHMLMIVSRVLLEPIIPFPFLSSWIPTVFYHILAISHRRIVLPAITRASAALSPSLLLFFSLFLS